MTTPTPPATLPAMPERFFASYFDVVTYPASPDPTVTFPVDNWSQRWQWIVMPRPLGAPPETPIFVFNRHQNPGIDMIGVRLAFALR